MRPGKVFPGPGTLLRRTKNMLLHGEYIPTEYYVNDHKRLVYISIPKVACTSLKIALFSRELENRDNKNEYMGIHRLATEYCHHQLPAGCRKYFKFAFVRNPFDRLVSCYADKARTAVQHNGKYYFSSKYNHVLIRKLYGNSFSQDMAFEDFIRLVHRIPDCLSDAHFKSQYSVLYRKGKPVTDFVGHFENLASDWDKIAQRFDLPPLQQKNIADRSYWKDYYSSSGTVKLVADRYKNDIDHFGYNDICDELLHNAPCRQE